MFTHAYAHGLQVGDSCIGVDHGNCHVGPTSVLEPLPLLGRVDLCAPPRARSLWLSLYFRRRFPGLRPNAQIVWIGGDIALALKIFDRVQAEPDPEPPAPSGDSSVH